jgi:DNA-binding MarR family transcriptional regulator
MSEMSSPLLKTDTDSPLEDVSEPRAQDVIETLVTTSHAIHRFGETRLAHYKPQAKLSPSRLRVLKTVALKERLRMGDLAELLGVAARTVTDLVDGLEREGMLTRRPDPTDRRATLVELSPAMQKKWEQVRGLIGELSEDVLSPLDASERRQLFDLLNRLKAGPIRDVEADPLWEDAGDCPE